MLNPAQCPSSPKEIINVSFAQSLESPSAAPSNPTEISFAALADRREAKLSGKKSALY